MTDTSQVVWTTNPLSVEKKVESDANPGNHSKPVRVSLWFVTHQKTEGWNEQKLNMLHKTMVILILFTVYIQET